VLSPAAVTLTSELPGRTEASRVAQVRARTAGIVLQRVFKEGGDVKAGEVLFRIDPAQFQASYDSGANWVTRDATRVWHGAAISGDGVQWVASVYAGKIYTPYRELTRLEDAATLDMKIYRDIRSPTARTVASTWAAVVPRSQSYTLS